MVMTRSSDLQADLADLRLLIRVRTIGPEVADLPDPAEVAAAFRRLNSDKTDICKGWRVYNTLVELQDDGTKNIRDCASDEHSHTEIVAVAKFQSFHTDAEYWRSMSFAT